MSIGQNQVTCIAMPAVLTFDFLDATGTVMVYHIPGQPTSAIARTIASVKHEQEL